jgi:hypothetical protein
MLSPSTLLLKTALLGGALVTLAACADECTGSIETTVLYAKPGPGGVGRATYVDVVNKPGLGIKKTLLYEGKEFGTFEHVVIIQDRESRFARNRTICFSTYRVNAPAAAGDLNEEDIPVITIEK